jgi:ATP-dependent protease HslVU (ClpYQ) peptidase subunit
LTLILATPHGIWADRRITDYGSGETCDPVKKLVSNDVLVAGFSGNLGTILAAIDMVKDGCENPKELALVSVDKIDVEGLVVKNNRIYTLDLKKAWIRPKRCAYYAMGSGGSVAMAFLAGRTSRTGKIKDKDIKDAFKYCSKARIDCGSSIDFIPAA